MDVIVILESGEIGIVEDCLRPCALHNKEVECWVEEGSARHGLVIKLGIVRAII
ncbi:hypothetical protein L0B53_06220 [Vibrio sp. SS-MA-C1-2]|uniref:hypothetical protein n=1 Tax=Vibrio sp. SS-MA-C1-2 TaxID=2908646 RepID=UPI001F190A7B|nr:hypothetical protein [Vibrio sp. SS-MA-C1-2]UJF19170.1 hypothetical protein L0B53_06220 [Vibrio sp. SS-MA-C1-2]